MLRSTTLLICISSAVSSALLFLVAITMLLVSAVSEVDYAYGVWILIAAIAIWLAAIMIRESCRG